MKSVSPDHRPWLDGKSLRYLGLLVGLCGLIYLSWRSSAQAPPAHQADSAEVRDTTPSKLSEAWLEALWVGDGLAVGRLLDAGLLADGVLDRRDTRPLHLLFFGDACRYGKASEGVLLALDLLLDAGAQVNHADQRGNTPLMLAAAECDPATVARLLAAGARLDATNALGLTAFELTLSNASATGAVLADAGFRLPPDQFSRYQEIYFDEPAILQQLSLADPGRR